jgi:hypothetical protein
MKYESEMRICTLIGKYVQARSTFQKTANLGRDLNSHQLFGEKVKVRCVR